MKKVERKADEAARGRQREMEDAKLLILFALPLALEYCERPATVNLASATGNLCIYSILHNVPYIAEYYYILLSMALIVKIS